MDLVISPRTEHDEVRNGMSRALSLSLLSETDSQ